MVTNFIHMARISQLIWSFLPTEESGKKMKICVLTCWALPLVRSAPPAGCTDRDLGSYGHSWFWGGRAGKSYGRTAEAAEVPTRNQDAGRVSKEEEMPGWPECVSWLG